jgi:micrococcal nuclease
LRLDRRRKDRYDRFLAYVYVEDQMLNEELVRAGLARVSVYPGDSPQIAKRLREAEQEAQKANRGIWQK